MKNRDMPANPIMLENGEVWDEEHDHASGLTKREYAAIKIASGMTANSAIIDTFGGYKSVARASVALADAIFDELEDSQ